ncbi:MAG: hypothetical protein MJ224_01345 [archaeon]|nr:hypothetical protein [archaeon]
MEDFIENFQKFRDSLYKKREEATDSVVKKVYTSIIDRFEAYGLNDVF